MATADSIAGIYANLSSTSTKFNYFNNATEIGSSTISGTWSRAGNTITWTEADPEFTASSSVVINKIQVAYPTPLAFAGVLSNGSHTPVPLEDGEKIIYTSITISFTTPDL